MALDLFKLLGTIEVDNSKANKALDETSNKGEKTKGKLSSVFSAVGKGAVAVGKTIATGLAVGGAAFAGLTAKALGAAGELEQNMGGSEAVFGKYAGKMQDTAKKAFSNMGLSTSDYLATANKMGALFQGAGFSIEESMNISSDAMQRAADVASIMGIDTGAAMEAIAGAAKGNFTMMDNLGVAMNDTTLQAYALSKGIDKSTSEMTNQEKIGLAMEMFMEKTAYAAGNYAKENETLAGSLGTAKAALTNFLDGSGSVEDLVKSFGNLANVAVKSLQEILPRLTTGLTEIVQKIIPMIPPLLNQLLPAIIEGATGLINGLVASIPSVLDALMGAIPALIQGVQTIFNAIVEALPGIMEALVSALPTLIPMLVDALVSMIVTLCTMLPQIIQPIIDYLPDIIISVVNALMSNLPALIQGVIALVLGIVAAIPQIITSLIDAIPIIIEMVITGLLNSLPALIQGVVQLVAGLVKALPQIFTSLVNGVVNVFKGIWNAIKTIIANVMNIIFSVIKGDWTSVKESIGNILNAIKSVISSVWNGIKNITSSIWNGIKNTISSVWNGIKSVVSSVVNGVKNTISSAFNGIKNVATSIWNGIKTAITKPIEAAKNTIKGIIDKIKGFFTGMKLKFPNIKLPRFSVSPSGWKIGDLLKGSIPKLSIKWYAEAMNNPMIMTKPTIFGYNAATGQLMGGGEVPGGEVVSGAQTLMNMIQTAVAAQNEALAYYLQKLIEMLADYFPQILEAAGHDIVTNDGVIVAHYAPKFNNALGKITGQKGRGR